jgi:hypothetical protein
MDVDYITDKTTEKQINFTTYGMLLLYLTIVQSQKLIPFSDSDKEIEKSKISSAKIRKTRKHSGTYYVPLCH